MGLHWSARRDLSLLIDQLVKYTRTHRDGQERVSLRSMLPAPLLLLASMACGADQPASCELASKSIVSYSSSGLAQVSNLGGVEIKCSVPARRFPTKPGERRNGLKVATAAYHIFPDGSKKLVPSEVQLSGGGFGPDPAPEWVDFDVLIPLEPADRDGEARRLIAKLEKSMAREPMTKEARRRELERVCEFVYQQRVGHFQVECRVMDGDRVMGVGIVEFEVLFKGRFSDVGLPGAPPA